VGGGAGGKLGGCLREVEGKHTLADTGWQGSAMVVVVALRLSSHFRALYFIEEEEKGRRVENDVVGGREMLRRKGVCYRGSGQ